MPTLCTSTDTQTGPLWQYNRALLAQAVDVIDRLQAQALPGFNYAQAVGPHLRHIIEHYQALLTAMDGEAPRCVDYDARERAPDVQNHSPVTRQRLLQLMDAMAERAGQASRPLDEALDTRLQSGLGGEYAVLVPSTLGRELLFLSSHTVHHFALLGHCCKAAGVDLGPDFGKAPATLAFERAAVCA